MNKKLKEKHLMKMKWSMKLTFQNSISKLISQNSINELIFQNPICELILRNQKFGKKVLVPQFLCFYHSTEEIIINQK